MLSEMCLNQANIPRVLFLCGTKKDEKQRGPRRHGKRWAENITKVHPVHVLKCHNADHDFV